jgi:hypothetical protein
MAAKITQKNAIVYSALVFCVASLCGLVICILKLSNRGFELSDETFYLYFSSHFNSDTYTVTNFGLLNNFFCFNNPSLFNLRLARFIYQSLAVLIFVLSLFKFLNKKNYKLSLTQQLFILVIGLMSSFFNYDYLPMTLSYNIWSLILMLLCFSIILIDYSVAQSAIAILTAALYGFFCFCFFLTKFPNAVIAVFIYLIFNVFSIKKDLGFKFFGLIIGALLGYFIFLNNLHDLKNIISNYYITVFDVKHVKATSYFSQFSDFFVFCCQKQFILIELIVILFSVITKKYIERHKWLAASGILVVNYAFIILFSKGNSAELYNDFIASVIMVINTILFIYMFYKGVAMPTPRKEFALVLFFTSIAPFCLMLGTDNQFYYTTSQTAVFLIIGAVIYLIYSKLLNDYFLALKACVICLFVVSIFYHGAVKEPYRQANLFQKKYPLTFTKPLDGILESYERFVDYNVMNSLLNEFNSSKKPIFTFFTHIGLGYINNVTVFPESPISDGAHTIWYDEYILNRTGFNDRFNLLVLPETVEKNNAFKVMLFKYGVKLHENYKLVYTYKFLSTNESIYFYKKKI